MHRTSPTPGSSRPIPFTGKPSLVAAGGFDEEFTSAWREDSELHFRLLAGGERLVQAPGAVVVHPVRPARWGVSISQQRKSMFNALLYKKHPALYRTHISPVHPWHYYAIVLALILSAACAAAGFRAAATVGRHCVALRDGPLLQPEAAGRLPAQPAPRARNGCYIHHHTARLHLLASGRGYQVPGILSIERKTDRIDCPAARLSPGRAGRRMQPPL